LNQDKFPEPEDSKTLQHVGWCPPNQRTQKTANVTNTAKIRKRGKHSLLRTWIFHHRWYGSPSFAWSARHAGGLSPITVWWAIRR